MYPIRLRDLPRQRRARIYAVALGEETAEFAYAEALEAAGRTGLTAADRVRLAQDALRYAIACHGLHDTTAARIACASLTRGVIPKPLAVIRQARTEDRRISRRTGHELSCRMSISLTADQQGEARA